MKSIQIIFFLFIGLVLCRCPQPPEPTLQLKAYKYFVRLPKDYDQQQACPLIVFLHGAGCGSLDYTVFKAWGMGDYADSTAYFPFIMVAPQTSEDWYASLLGDVLDQIKRDYRIDDDRIYITGFSMGGSGAYSLALAYPRRFAAIAPVCGWGSTERACEIAHLPFWIFHNEGDPVITARHSHEMVDSLSSCGASDLKSTFYSETTHDAWTATYHNPELYSWFLSHRRKL